MSIRNTQGPRERRFMQRLVAACWVYITLAFGLAWLVPMFRPWAWALIAGPVLLAVPKLNRKQQDIRRDEAANHLH